MSGKTWEMSFPVCTLLYCNPPLSNSSLNVTHLWHGLANPHILKLFIMHFYHHNMLVGVCRCTEKKKLEWFFIFCWKYEVNRTSRWSQNTPKIMVFGHYWYFINVLRLYKLFILDLLLKPHLLVPNLWLYDLAFRIYGPKRVKFGDFESEKETRKAFRECFHPQNTP